MPSKLSLPMQGPWNLVWVKQVFELSEVHCTFISSLSYHNLWLLYRKSEPPLRHDECTNQSAGRWLRAPLTTGIANWSRRPWAPPLSGQGERNAAYEAACSAAAQSDWLTWSDSWQPAFHPHWDLWTPAARQRNLRREHRGPILGYRCSRAIRLRWLSLIILMKEFIISHLVPLILGS